MRVPPALLHDLGPYPLLSDGFIDLAEIELPQPGQAVFVGEPAGWVETSAQSSRVSRRLGSRELPGGQMFDPWPQGPVTLLPGD